MPRSIKELIYYDRTRIFRKNWTTRVCERYSRVKKGSGLPSSRLVILRKNPLFRKALDYQRMQNNSDFDRKLRQNSEKSVALDYKHFRAVCLSEEHDRQNRQEVAEQNFIKHLKKQKHG